MDWDNEKECFHTFSHEYSCFYSVRHDPFLLESSERVAAAGGGSGSSSSGGGDWSGKIDEISSQHPSQGDVAQTGQETQVWLYFQSGRFWMNKHPNTGPRVGNSNL